VPGFGIGAPLLQSHDSPSSQINRGENNHGFSKTISAKFLSIFNPTAWLFSG
jgi:hypothetical protein